MRRLLKAFAMVVVLSGCAVQTPTDTRPPVTGDVEQLEAELEEAEDEIRSLRAERQSQYEQLSAVRSEASALRQQIAMLEGVLESAQASADADPQEVSSLQAALEQARSEQEAAIEEGRSLAEKADSLEGELALLQDQLESIDSELQSLMSSGAVASEDPELAASDVRGVDADDDRPHLQTVFYATNRARLIRHWSDFVKPFLLPLAAIGVGFILLFANRRYIKTQYQRRAAIGVYVLFGLIALVSLLRAAQVALQARQSDDILTVQYGNDLRTPGPGEAPYERGFVQVSIPQSRNVGEVPVPQLVIFEFVVDPTKHFQLASVTPSTEERFYTDVRETVGRDPERSAFVFVHGFHNTFQNAAFRTAQIAHDMGFEGAPIFFSWPSQGAVLDYLTDAKNVETTVLHLRLFLEELHAESGATRIHLIAHSMGSRALTQAIEDLAGTMPDENNFGQMVLAAPDIARDLLEQKVEALARITLGVTLYASEHDSALLLSRALQGQDERQYQRAGETHPAPMVAPPMQTIDVSRATRGHSYISDSPLMIRELRGLFDGSRVLTENSENFIPTGDSGYWLLQRSD